MMIVNDILKQYNNSTLKETSKDNSEGKEKTKYMTECESIKVINFDNLSKKAYMKKIMKEKILPFKTNDALFLDEKKRRVYFYRI